MSVNRVGIVEIDGVRRFRKHNGAGLPRHFEAEARGLELLAGAGCGLVVPRVIDWSDEPSADFLLIEHLETAPRGPGFDEALGRGLAALHRETADAFGFDLDGYCGLTPQPNPWTPDWPTFYAEHRLGHQLSLARSRGLGERVAGVVARVIARVPALVAPGPPSLIHGDLWSGNVLSTAEGPALIDPAAYFGHREAELGMMKLFGGFSDRVYAAYDEAWPLEPGWRDRLDLYALYHALNHYNLFGGGYASQAHDLARRYA
jgi:fructosamine-3-kinase